MAENIEQEVVSRKKIDRDAYLRERGLVRPEESPGIVGTAADMIRQAGTGILQGVIDIPRSAALLGTYLPGVEEEFKQEARKKIMEFGQVRPEPKTKLGGAVGGMAEFLGPTTGVSALASKGIQRLALGNIMKAIEAKAPAGVSRVLGAGFVEKAAVTGAGFAGGEAITSLPEVTEGRMSLEEFGVNVGLSGLTGGALGGATRITAPRLRLLGEYAALVGTRPAVEGRMPTRDELVYGGILLVGFKAVEAGLEKLSRVTNKPLEQVRQEVVGEVGKTGKTPGEVIEERLNPPPPVEAKFAKEEVIPTVGGPGVLKRDIPQERAITSTKPSAESPSAPAEIKPAVPASFMPSPKTQEGLKNLGYTEPEIDRMTYDEVVTILRDKVTNPVKESVSPSLPEKKSIAQVPIHELPSEQQGQIKGEAGQMVKEVEQGQPGSRFGLRDSETGETKGGFTRTTYPEYYGQLKRSKKEVLSALQKIIKDAGKDKGKLVEDLKSLIQDRLEGNKPRYVPGLGLEEPVPPEEPTIADRLGRLTAEELQVLEDKGVLQTILGASTKTLEKTEPTVLKMIDEALGKKGEFRKEPPPSSALGMEPQPGTTELPGATPRVEPAKAGSEAKTFPQVGETTPITPIARATAYHVWEGAPLFNRKAILAELGHNQGFGEKDFEALPPTIQDSIARALEGTPSGGILREIDPEVMKLSRGAGEALAAGNAQLYSNYIREISRKLGATTVEVPADLGKELEKDPSTIKLEKTRPGEKERYLVVDISSLESLKNDPQRFETVMKTVENVFKEDFDFFKRGKISAEERRALADKVGLSPEDILGFKPGTTLPAEVSEKVVDTIITLTEYMIDANKRGVSEKDLRGWFNLIGLLTGKYRATVSEGARTQQAQQTLKAKKVESVFQNLTSFALLSGEKLPADNIPLGRLKTIINSIEKEQSKVTTLVKAAQEPPMWLEAWINGLLSGPPTHVVNFLGNVYTMMAGVPERYLAEKMHFGESPGAAHGEAAAMLQGLMGGIGDALRIARAAFETGEPQRGLAKFTETSQKAITGKRLNEYYRRLTGVESDVVTRFGDGLGEFVRLPGRFLMTSDEFFKSLNYRMELHARAWRQAVNVEGLEGRKAAERMAEIVQNPPENIKVLAEDYAAYATFTNELGPMGQSLMQFANSHPLARVVLPFIRTPANIFKYDVERIPGVALALGQVRADMAAGGIRRDMVMAKMAMGSMIMGYAAYLAKAGYITGGGPQDKELRKTLQLTGWQPYSVKIGDTYYGINRFDPAGALFGMAADFVEIGNDLSDHKANWLATALVLPLVSGKENILSKSYMQGIVNVVEAIESPDKRWHEYAKNLARSVVPAGLAGVARVDDPVRKEVWGILDAMKARVPGYSKEVPPKRNIFGEPMMIEGPSLVSPIYVSKGKKDAVAEEIVRLGIRLGMPAKFMGGARPPTTDPLAVETISHGIALDAKQYDRLVVLAGKPLRGELERLFEGGFYRRQTDAGKALLVSRTVSALRERARGELLDEFPELRKAMGERLMQRQEALTPSF